MWIIWVWGDMTILSGSQMKNLFFIFIKADALHPSCKTKL
jgi:hypothetical protein